MHAQAKWNLPAPEGRVLPENDSSNTTRANNTINGKQNDHGTE